MDQGIYPEGTVIDGRYRIVRRLGRGGFATVYEAEHLQLGRRAALKVLEPVAPHITERFQSRFNTEARIAANLDHPNVVRIFDFGFIEGDQRPYMAMELLEGSDLEVVLEDSGGMDPERAKRLFIPILDALRLGHERGIVHKDLKPANLFFVKEGQPDEKLVVLDYGIARLEGDDNPRFTEEGTYTGTPAYMPPEYIHRREVTPAYDVYQIGLIFIEAMTGQAVVVAGSQIAYLVAHVEGKRRLPEGFGDTPLGAALLKAIEVEPGDRYADAGQMLDAIRIADVSKDTDFTLPAITLDETEQQQISSFPKTTLRQEIPPKPVKSGTPIGVILAIVAVMSLVGCTTLAIFVGIYAMLDQEHHDLPTDLPTALVTPIDPPEQPTMPRIANYPAEGQELASWLLARQWINVTLYMVSLYEKSLTRDPWSAKGTSFVPTGSADLLGGAGQHIATGMSTPPQRKALESAAKQMASDLTALQDTMADLYDYHSVSRGWQVDKGAHGKALTKQLFTIVRRIEPLFANFSTQAEKELLQHLAKCEDAFVGNKLLQLSARAMIAQTATVTEISKNPAGPKANKALSAFDTALQNLDAHIRGNRDALAEQYQMVGPLHARFLDALKDTRKQAGDIRAKADAGEDASGDIPGMQNQIYSTFDVFNQLQRF